MPSKRPVRPLGGTDDDRILAEEVGGIFPQEVHTTYQGRLFYKREADIPSLYIAPVYHGEVDSASALITLNEDNADLGVHRADFAYVAETDSLWVCLENRGEQPEEWFNLGAGGGSITGSNYKMESGRLLGRFSEGIGPIEIIRLTGGLGFVGDQLTTEGLLVNTHFTSSKKKLIGNSLDEESTLEEIGIGGELELDEQLLFIKMVPPIKGGTGLDEYTKGDLIYATDEDVLAPVSIGTTGQVLTVVGGVPAWADAAGSGDITTDKAWAAKGDLIVATGNDAAAIVSIGSSNQVLTVVGGTAAWANLPSHTTISNDTIWDAKGDIVYATGNDAAARLAIGSSNQVLTVVSGQPAWAAAPTGDITKDTAWNAKGDLIVATANDAASILGIGSTGQVLTVASGTAAWATPKTVANDTIWDAAGDLVRGTGSDTASRLAIGSTGQVLTVVSGQPAWQNNVGFNNPMTTAGDLMIRNATNANARLAIGKTAQVLNVAGTGIPAWANLPTQKGTWIEGNVTSPDVPLTWVSNGDANGVFYYIGTAFGSVSWSNPQPSAEIRVFLYQNPSSLTNASITNRTSDSGYIGGGSLPNYIAFDLGNNNRKLLLTDYSVQNYNQDNRYLRNWKLQGTSTVGSWDHTGINGASWTDLDVRSGDTTMNGGASSWGHYTIGSPGSTRYRYFRLLQTGGDSLGGNYLCVSEVELYGDFEHELGQPDYLLNLLPQVSTPNPPDEGFIIYCEAGELRAQDSSGNVTKLA